jgi:hypothetical protein
MDAIGAAIGFILLFLPIILYVVRRKDYDGSTILIGGVAFFIVATIAGWIAWWLFGKNNMWIGFVCVWIYAMYIALKKID